MNHQEQIKEVGRWLSLLERDLVWKEYILIFFSINYGLKVSEIKLLCWSDIISNERIIRLFGNDFVNTDQRIIKKLFFSSGDKVQDQIFRNNITGDLMSYTYLGAQLKRSAEKYNIELPYYSSQYLRRLFGNTIFLKVKDSRLCFRILTHALKIEEDSKVVKYLEEGE